MCGIFVYSGKSKSAFSTVLKGLKLLEYRGYDSWGLGFIQNGEIEVKKAVGEIGNPEDLLKSIGREASICLGHTRWATHGGVTIANAHPHYSTKKDFVIAHNGIVENFEELKLALLGKGYEFFSETDTEVIARQIEENLKSAGDFMGALIKTFSQIRGRNTVAILDKKGNIYAAKMGSPLVIGLSDDSEECYLSSDALSLSPWVKRIVVIENGWFLHIKDGVFSIVDKSNKEVKSNPEPLEVMSQKLDKQGFEYFMEKEIHETPFVIQQVIKQERKELESFAKALKTSRAIYLIASGTAGVAAAQTAFYLRKYAKLRAQGFVGAESSELINILDKSDLVYAPSQSGETADVLEVLERVQANGIPIASYVNMPGSTMSRISNYKFMANAGAEICVMSTKVFTSQIAFGYLMAKTAQGEYEEGLENLKKTQEEIRKLLIDKTVQSKLKDLAKKLCKEKDLFILAKDQNLQISREAMVKIIEGSYIHAHSIPAGDLKHYAITLMEKGVQVLFILSSGESYHDALNAVHEIKARGASAIVFGKEPHESFDEFVQIPNCGECDAIMNIVPLQLLAYYMAKELGNNVDKPRNIAKSVTVK